jgi:hypothetical protein
MERLARVEDATMTSPWVSSRVRDHRRASRHVLSKCLSWIRRRTWVRPRGGTRPSEEDPGEDPGHDRSRRPIGPVESMIARTNERLPL